MSENYGIKISKAGSDVTDTPSESNKKNFTILSTVSTIKVSTQGVVSTNTNVEHGLGFIPAWDAYVLKNSSSEAHPVTSEVSADDTYLYITASSSNKVFYIIYLNEP